MQLACGPGWLAAGTGERWRLLVGGGWWEEVGFLLTLGRRPRGPAGSLRGPAGGRTAGAPPPCWGPGGLWPQGPKPISRHRPRKMVTGRREDRAAEGPAASVPAETRQPPGSCGHTWGRRGLALQLNQAEESERRGVMATSLGDKSVQADQAWTPEDHPAGSAQCHPSTRGG